MRFPLASLLALGALVASSAPALADPGGRTTAESGIGIESRAGLRVPVADPGRGHAVRTLVGLKSSKRDPVRRRSLAFFAHLTDPQLADEMSPARLEYLGGGGKFFAAWRLHEALGPQTFDLAVRNVNRNRVSRVPDGRGRRATLDLALVTGDLSDNHQLNEVRWGVRLLEGGRVDPFSGRRVGPGNRCPGASRRVIRRLNAAVAGRRYTGVQDSRDYPGLPASVYGRFWDPGLAPASPGPYAALPSHPGLMERAQRPFRAEGLQMPWFGVRGNHDGAAQGFFAGRPGAGVATGCRKAFPTRTVSRAAANPWDRMRARLRRPGGFRRVPPDPARRFVSAREFKRLHGRADRRHGFGLVPAAARRASRDAAGYYTWAPRPGVRFVALDTVAQGGGDQGNLDHPQYRWLQGVLRRARTRNEVVMVYGHHSLETMLGRRRDELSPCGPGVLACDEDPRSSTPLHLGQSGRANLRNLLLSSPNVILYLTGHVHRGRVVPHMRADGRSGFWQVTTPSTLSYPQQSRLIELMDNGNDTLSIMSTMLDTAAPVAAPATGTPGAGMSHAQLGSLSRLLAANVRGESSAVAAQAGVSAPAFPAGNVELLVRDPR